MSHLIYVDCCKYSDDGNGQSHQGAMAVLLIELDSLTHENQCERIHIHTVLKVVSACVYWRVPTSTVKGTEM